MLESYYSKVTGLKTVTPIGLCYRYSPVKQYFYRNTCGQLEKLIENILKYSAVLKVISATPSPEQFEKNSNL